MNNDLQNKVSDMKKFALAAGLFLTVIGVNAQPYVELGYTGVTATYGILGSELKSSPNAIRGILGYELNQNLSIEGLVGSGLESSSVKVDGINVNGATTKINNFYGLYLKPKSKVTDRTEFFARIGASKAKGTATVAGLGSASESETSFSYGAGFSYTFSPNTSWNLDYMSYINKDGFKANGFTLGLGYKF